MGAVILMGLWVVAWTLTPSSQGLGTHQQLGLPPCTMRVVWGIRCPSCGMTTSWAYLANGQLRASFGANPAGLLLGLTTLWALPSLTRSALTGWVWTQRRQWSLAVALMMVIVIAIVDWLQRLYL